MNNTFVNLASFERDRLQTKKLKGNIVKKESLVCRGRQKVYSDDGDGNQPSIIVHRNNNAVDGVEFICTCGKSSKITFDYEGE